MNRGLYIAATGMLTQRKKMNVLVNNIANADTYGYKSDKLLTRSFEETLLERRDALDAAGADTQIGLLGSGVHIDEVVTTYLQGSLDQTELATDLAITGEGFFVVQTPNGIRYTRNGNFTISNGNLVTAEGYTVLGTGGGAINVKNGNFTVASNGEIAVDGAAAGQLQIVRFANTGALTKEGNCYFVNTGAAPAADEESTVVQGYLEVSDVNLADTMVEVIKVTRLYDTNQRILTAIDETLQKACNEIGRV